jgi:MarR family transcriptional regulator, organic hydroperoxide resistance regulator
MSPPFRKQLLAYLLAWASHVVNKDFMEVLKRRGITMRQWRILGTLWDEENLTVNELAAFIMCAQPTTTRLVERLVVAGLIGKRTGSDDRRKVYAYLTDQGRTMVSDLVTLAAAADREFAEAYGLDNAEALKVELRVLIDRHTRSCKARRRGLST